MNLPLVRNHYFKSMDKHPYFLKKKEVKYIMNERKTFNHKDDEKLNQLHALLNDARNMIFGENRNLQRAKNKIQEFMNEASELANKDDPNLYNFDSAIDFILYSKINKSKTKTVCVPSPLRRI